MNPLYLPKLFTDRPEEALGEICAFVCNGGALPSLCRDVYKVHYDQVMKWIRADREREKKYVQALNDRNEVVSERVLAEIRALAFTKMTEIFAPDGTVRPLAEWEDDLCRGLASLEVEETYGDGKTKPPTGRIVKLKFHPKLQALEMAAKNLLLLTQKHEVSLELSYDQVIMASMGLDPNRPPTPAAEVLSKRVTRQLTAPDRDEI